MDHAVARGTAATLAIGRLASGRFGLPYKHVRTLFISVVRPKLEYGVAVWYTPIQEVPGKTRRRGSAGFATRLERVQRIATRLITGAFKTAPTVALEYHADLMPMDIQLNHAAFCAALRLATLPEHHPLHKAVQTSRASAPRYFKSPIHKLFIAFPHLHDVEVIDATPRRTTWTAPLSTSIAPSREEAALAALAAEDSGAFVVYSDGSGEHGRVGAAAVAAHPQGGIIARRAYLGQLTRHTVFEGELFGVLLALRMVRELPGIVDVVVCLDNQSAIIRVRDPRPKPGQLITTAIHEALARLRKHRAGFRLQLVWVPGHEGVEGNELADLHAKQAAAGEDCERAEIHDDWLPDSAAALRAEHRQQSRLQWQRRWTTSEHGYRYSRFDDAPPSAQVPRMYNGLRRAHAAILTQLRTGHIALNHYLFRFGAVDSPLCTRCGEPETVDHFLLRCSRFLAPRQVLRGQLRGQVLSIHTLLGVRKNLSALMSYVEQTGRLEIRGRSRPSSSSSQSQSQSQTHSQTHSQPARP